MSQPFVPQWHNGQPDIGETDQTWQKVDLVDSMLGGLDHGNIGINKNRVHSIVG